VLNAFRAWRSHRRVAFAVVCALTVAVVLILRVRSQPRTPGPAEAFAVPGGDIGAPPTVSGTSGAAEGAGEAAGAAAVGDEAACGSGSQGPLRSDTALTADDGKGTQVKYSISLPDDYYTSCKRYPVIYALHGKNQTNITFMDEAVALRGAMAAGVLEQSVIVTPDSYLIGRWENRDTGPAEDNVIKYLIPYVEKNYRVRQGPSYRLLTGFSMGGHGALRFGLKYPRTFAAVWSVDGAMAGSDVYLPFVRGKSTADFRIIAVGGKLNGDRVQRLVQDLGKQGVTIPYVYQDLDHEFVDFVREDQRTGWYAMKYLQHYLGRPL
jgi:predicted esterase